MTQVLPYTRPPLERMLRIHQALKGGGYPNAASLARQLEVSSKSIHRDLEFMRDRLGLPIEYDPTRFGYYYSEEVENFPTIQFTEGELFALVVAEKALQQYRGTSFERPLLSALKKMEQSLPDTISLSLTDIDQTISFRTRAEPVQDLATFDALAKATAARQQIRFSYRKPGQRQPEPRVVDPYHLANINGEWFLFAYDHLRQDIRTFVPARITAIERTGRTFQRQRGFSLEKRLQGSFGVQSGHGEFSVVIRFNKRVADYIREKKWHSSQSLRDLRDGGVELTMRLSSLGEVERWVLSWGGDATVLRPSELAESVRKAARRIVQASPSNSRAPGDGPPAR
ncbi:MAG TPA: WYL domain-containing transcriptional regulator [Candidatus Acidoferrum sp.]|nr:WYL domain-containing transcriptional regulator [Candidatus Acidoferrum sp.]